MFNRKEPYVLQPRVNVQIPPRLYHLTYMAGLCAMLCSENHFMSSGEAAFPTERCSDFMTQMP